MGGKYGFSWSWKRASGLSGLKGKISREIGIPLTRSGRERKAGRAVMSIFGPAISAGRGRASRRRPVESSAPSGASASVAGCLGMLLVAGLAVVAVMVFFGTGTGSPEAPAPVIRSTPPSASPSVAAAPLAPAALAVAPIAVASSSPQNAPAVESVPAATQPTRLTSTEARVRLTAAQRRVDEHLNQNWAYVKAASDLKAAEARAASPNAEAADRLALGKARLNVAKIRQDQYDHDADVIAARSELAAAVQVESQARAEQQATLAATAAVNLPAASSDAVTPAPSYSTDVMPNYSSGARTSSGPKDVHVNGYTRKDGTHVKAHERSSPH